MPDLEKWGDAGKVNNLVLGMAATNSQTYMGAMACEGASGATSQSAC